MLALGFQSKREITRTKIRVRTASKADTWMAARRTGTSWRTRARTRPGCMRRAHRLEPDPATAPVVAWIFAERLAGHSAARIARALNDAGIPCPSAADPKRNPHRAGIAWTLSTVAAILANPRYTGRQVWNRQRTDSNLVDPANTGLGHRTMQRWNLPAGWVISARPAHPALVSEADYIAAQDTSRPRRPAGPGARNRAAEHGGVGDQVHVLAAQPGHLAAAQPGPGHRHHDEAVTGRPARPQQPQHLNVGGTVDHHLGLRQAVPRARDIPQARGLATHPGWQMPAVADVVQRSEHLTGHLADHDRMPDESPDHAQDPVDPARAAHVPDPRPGHRRVRVTGRVLQPGNQPSSAGTADDVSAGAPCIVRVCSWGLGLLGPGDFDTCPEFY